MNDTSPHSTWTEANQHYLVTEFARIKLRLGADGDAQDAARALNEARTALTAPAAIDVLTDGFGLNSFERDILLLCAGVEMNAELARLCGEAQGYPQRCYATFGLALGALENPYWSALAPVGPLRRWRLIEVDDGAGLVAGRLRIDERILHYLVGVNCFDTRLQAIFRPMVRPFEISESQRKLCRAIRESLTERSNHPPAVVLVGDDLDGQGYVASHVAADLGLQLYRVRATDLPQSIAEIDALAVLWQREAVLLGSIPLVECRDTEVPKPAVSLCERINDLVFIAGREVPDLNRPTLRFVVNRPESGEQKHLWEQALGPAASRLNGSLDGVVSQFRLSAQAIFSIGEDLRGAMAASQKPDLLLWNACRGLSRSKLDDLAQRIEPMVSWEDLILPETQKATLLQIAAHVKHRLKVYQDWAFATKSLRGLGINALFSGESGTGKTMAAEVLANELHLDLYRIDLSSVVSKYIGETEKNLGRVFDAAEDSGVILLFDEADALFGKRTEVKDSHDRYANIEVSYLLQRMEAYRGLAILTTNMNGTLDRAFLRRIRFVVQFPFPDAIQRSEIWRRMFPAATPTDALDYMQLGRLQIAGGNIRNIAMNAAFLAADMGEPVRMSHLLRTARSECAKIDKAVTPAELGGWV